MNECTHNYLRSIIQLAETFTRLQYSWCRLIRGWKLHLIICWSWRLSALVPTAGSEQVRKSHDNIWLHGTLNFHWNGAEKQTLHHKMNSTKATNRCRQDFTQTSRTAAIRFIITRSLCSVGVSFQCFTFLLQDTKYANIQAHCRIFYYYYSRCC